MTGTPDHLLDAALFPAAPGNYGSRNNAAVDLVIIHATEGSFHSACIWFANPKAKASAHYVVSRAGAIAQCVPEGAEAWHAGNALVNRRSIGVELEGYSAQPQSFPPDALVISVAAQLVAGICDRHGVPVDREHILGHCDVADPGHPSEEWIHGGAHHHSDPGPYFPWPDFMRLVVGLSERAVA